MSDEGKEQKREVVQISFHPMLSTKNFTKNPTNMLGGSIALAPKYTEGDLKLKEKECFGQEPADLQVCSLLIPAQWVASSVKLLLPHETQVLFQHHGQ